VAASPSARKLARERGINLKAITGTGPGGRITKKDVLAAVSAQCREQPTVADEDTVVPFSPMRARIAQRLTHSKRSIPHFYISMDVDMSEALAWRQSYNDKSGMKVTITDMIIKATASALSEFRRINGHVEDDKIILRKAIHIGVAVSVEEGLIVPVIADADQKSLDEISAASKQNAEAAKLGRLKPQSPGTFTITNLGMHAVHTFVPIINPPECAILAVGTIARKPAVVAGTIAVREVMTATLACDHRAVDGTYAAQFLERIKYCLENPSSLED
jgi:pyruvate dehydrogenase E2 component (dihydrolipoamide acetyltransferase)